MEAQTLTQAKLVVNANKNHETISFYGPPELPETTTNTITLAWKNVFKVAHVSRHLKVLTKIVIAPEYCLVLGKDFQSWLIQRDALEITGIFVNIHPKNSKDHVFEDFHTRISDGEEDGNYLVGIPIKQIRSLEFALI